MISSIIIIHFLVFGMVKARISNFAEGNTVQFTPTSSDYNTCTDTDGIKRRIGEEWTVRQHFVLLCHEVPSGDPWPIRRVEVIACLREDGQTRMAIGEQVQEQGMTLVCRRAGQGPTGEVRREWQIAPGRGARITSPSASSISTFGTNSQFDNNFSSNGCLNRAIGLNTLSTLNVSLSDKGERWQRRSFELECSSPYGLPKMVACIPPELNGQRILAGESLNVGRFTVVCINRPDGSYGYRYE